MSCHKNSHLSPVLTALAKTSVRAVEFVQCGKRARRRDLVNHATADDSRQGACRCIAAKLRHAIEIPVRALNWRILGICPVVQTGEVVKYSDGPALSHFEQYSAGPRAARMRSAELGSSIEIAVCP